MVMTVAFSRATLPSGCISGTPLLFGEFGICVVVHTIIVGLHYSHTCPYTPVVCHTKSRYFYLSRRPAKRHFRHKGGSPISISCPIGTQTQGTFAPFSSHDTYYTMYNTTSNARIHISPNDGGCKGAPELCVYVCVSNRDLQNILNYALPVQLIRCRPCQTVHLLPTPSVSIP